MGNRPAVLQSTLQHPLQISHRTIAGQINKKTALCQIKLEPDLISEVDYGAQSEHDADEDGGAPDAEDAPDAAEEAQLEEAEHFDELGCIGFALAKSVSLMGDINSRF